MVLDLRQADEKNDEQSHHSRLSDPLRRWRRRFYSVRYTADSLQGGTSQYTAVFIFTYGWTKIMSLSVRSFLRCENLAWSSKKIREDSVCVEEV